MATITETTGDAAASNATTYSMSPGDTFTGRLSERIDEDWIRIELRAGLTYEINLTGDGSDGAADTILKVYNAAGAQVTSNDDVDFSAGNLFSMVSYAPVSNGVYYISASSYTANPNQQNWGDYRLTVSNPGGTAPMDEDEDMVDESTTVTQEDGDETDIVQGDIIEGGPGPDVLTGGHGNDMLYGLDDDDVLDGREGDDWLEGGWGADEFRGGPGEDTISYESYSTGRVEVVVINEMGLPVGTSFVRAGIEARLHNGVLRGGPAEGDTFAGMQTIEYIDGEGNTRMVEVPDVENLYGSEGKDILVGAHGSNRLDGNGDGDKLDGREGDDWLYGGADSDVLTGGPGADLLSGGPGYDYASYEFSDTGVIVRLHTVLETGGLGGDAEGDTFVGLTSSFTDDQGNTRMVEVPDIEILIGSNHGDVLAGDFRFNVIWGLAGDDKLYGGPDGGDDRLLGGAGNDEVYGGKGNDLLYGGDGDDLLKGGPGDDTMEKERENVLDEEKTDESDFYIDESDRYVKTVRHDSGNDRLEGGAGDDVFYFYPGGGDDVILDFGNGGDRIVLSAFEDIQSIDDLNLQDQGGNLVIDLSGQGGGTITLQNFNEADLMDAHFMFS